MKKILFTLLLFPIASIGQIASWDFAGEATLPTSTPEIYDVNLDSPSLLTRGSSAAESAGGNSFRTVGFMNDGISVANTDYFENTLSAAAGYALSLSTIDARFNGTGSYCISPGVTMQYAYSLDGTSFTLIGSPFIVVGGPGIMNQIDLSGITALQNVPAATTVTIRFYASGQTLTGGWGYASFATPGTIGLAFGGTLTLAGGGCNLATSGLAALTCNDATTGADPLDDFLTFNLNPTGSTLGATYSVSVSAGTILPATGTYGAATSFALQAGSAGAGNVTVTITDDATALCTLPVSIVDPGACSSATPVITVNPASLTGFSHIVGTPSTEQTFTASGLGLTANITLAAPANFEISTTTGTGFASMLTLAQTAGIVSATTIYVRANAPTMGTISGDVSAISAGATTQNVALTGEALDYVSYLIEDVNTLDTNGVADSLNVLVELSGVVHCIDFDGNAGYSFAIIDESEVGINIFRTTDFGTYTSPMEGDSVMVKGSISQFNGLLQVTVVEITLLYQDATLADPLVVTVLDETSESQYVQILNVTFVTPITVFPTGNNNIAVTDGTTTFTLRIDADTDIPGSATPAGSFNVIGIGGQFDSSSPFNSGYQLFPCGMTSFEPTCTTPSNAVTSTSSTTANATATGINYQWINCSDSSEIFGATSQSYTAGTSGDYAVIVIDGECSDTSICVALVGLDAGINSIALSNVNIYPNPMENVVTISGLNNEFYTVSISDVNGKIVYTNSFAGKQTIETSTWLKGFYFLNIKNNDNQMNTKVIK